MKEEFAYIGLDGSRCVAAVVVGVNNGAMVRRCRREWLDQGLTIERATVEEAMQMELDLDV